MNFIQFTNREGRYNIDNISYYSPGQRHSSKLPPAPLELSYYILVKLKDGSLEEFHFSSKEERDKILKKLDNSITLKKL